MSCTRRRGEDRTPRRTHMFLSLVVSGTRTSEHFLNHAYAWRTSLHRVTVHLWCLEWFAPLRIQNTSSSLMSHPNLLGLHVRLVFLYTITATSDNMLYGTGEGIADRNQVPLKRNFAGETVWLFGRLNPSRWPAVQAKVLIRVSPSRTNGGQFADSACWNSDVTHQFRRYQLSTCMSLNGTNVQ